MYRGWVHAETGQVEQGIVGMRQTLTEARDGTRNLPTIQSGYLAEALARAGRVDGACRCWRKRWTSRSAPAYISASRSCIG